MKLAILADIHGNFPALKAVLKQIEGENIEKILIGGDFLGAPYPIEVITTLDELKAIMIQGNFEGYLIKIFSNPSDSEWYRSKQWSPTYWVYKHLNQYWLEFIKALPKQKVISIDNTEEILMIHSLHDDMLPTDNSGILQTDIYDEILDSYTRTREESVIIFAHNHVPYIKIINGVLALNPGSVGCPLNGRIGAQYALLEWKNGDWQTELRTVPYNIDEIASAFVESGYLKEGGLLTKLNLKCIQTGKAYMVPFFKFLQELAEKEGYKDYDFFPDELLELAEKKWDWNIYK